MSNEYMDEMQSGASGTGVVPEDGMPAGREDGVVVAPVHTPVAGTRRAAEDGERSVRRLSHSRKGNNRIWTRYTRSRATAP